MKWATLSTLSSGHHLSAPEKEFFTEITLPLSLIKTYTPGYLNENLREELKHEGFTEWVTYPGDKGPNLDDKMHDEKVQRKYEIFCGGFLYFYDAELMDYIRKLRDEYPKKFPHEKKGFGEENINNLEKFFKKIHVGESHTIFFEWGINPSNDRFSVRIYINPPAGNPDPPKPPAPPPPESYQ